MYEVSNSFFFIPYHERKFCSKKCTSAQAKIKLSVFLAYSNTCKAQSLFYLVQRFLDMVGNNF